MDDASYKSAGVDIEGADESVERIRDLVAGTHSKNVLSGIGGFGGLYGLDASKYNNPVLVSSTDGVGTKSYIASKGGIFNTIGIDLVAMCVDDLVCTGAEPLFMLDYVSVERLNPEIIEDIVSGVAKGCKIAKCSLIGGEMAEHPPERAPGNAEHPPERAPGNAEHPPVTNYKFDLAGFAVGIVERDKMLDPSRVELGDELIGVFSPGIRCNGYSLARHVLLELANRKLDELVWPGAQRTLLEELLLPSRIYAPSILQLIHSVEVHGIAHITGGGIPGNLPRVLPSELSATIDAGSWGVPRIFYEIQSLGNISMDEMSRVFNLGIGMVVVVGKGCGHKAVSLLERYGEQASVIGSIVENEANSSCKINWSGSSSLKDFT